MKSLGFTILGAVAALILSYCLWIGPYRAQVDREAVAVVSSMGRSDNEFQIIHDVRTLQLLRDQKTDYAIIILETRLHTYLGRLGLGGADTPTLLASTQECARKAGEYRAKYPPQN
jgi:hypothetical protein